VTYNFGKPKFGGPGSGFVLARHLVRRTILESFEIYLFDETAIVKWWYSYMSLHDLMGLSHADIILR